MKLRLLLALASFALVPLCLKAELPDKVLDAAKNALPNWSLDYADSSPKVDAGDGAKGYRVLFTRRYDEDIESNVTNRTKPRFNHVDLVLVPQQRKGFDQLDARTTIPWSKIPEEYFTTPRWLGSGLGFEWFCRSNIPTMESFRKELKLTGGEPRVNILCSGLDADDRDHATAKYVTAQLTACGKDAIPGITEAISSMLREDKTPYAPMYALKGLNMEPADNALVVYASNSDTRLQNAAGAALCLPPYVEKAKQIYLKMISSRSNITPSADAAITLGFQADALPLLEKVAGSPANIFEFRDATTAISAIRSGKRDPTPFEIAGKITDLALHSGELPGTAKTLVLGEKPADTKAKLAEADLKRLKPLETQLATYPDQDLAFIAALWLCLFKVDMQFTESAIKEQQEAGIKAYCDRVHESGLRIMNALQKPGVEQKLTLLSRRSMKKEEADEVKKVLRRYISSGISIGN